MSARVRSSTFAMEEKNQQRSEAAPSNGRKWRLGTRGSALALVQAEQTEALLAMAHEGAIVERVVIKTTGDRRTDVALAEVAKVEGVVDKGVFIKELEIALDAGEIDFAVHSLKDVPTVLEDKFALGGVLERAPVKDVLVTRSGATLLDLPSGSVVGTSSVRRAMQVKHLRGDVEIRDIRGNVPTRLAKLAAGEYDAIMLAEAGLVRLGYLRTVGESEQPEPVANVDGLFAERLDEALFYPAAGQGAIAFEIRADDEEAREFLASICHEETWKRVSAEREFLRLLDAGCHTPVGVYSELAGDVLTLRGRVFPEQGGEPKVGEAQGSDPIAVAAQLYQSLQ